MPDLWRFSQKAACRPLVMEKISAKLKLSNKTSLFWGLRCRRDATARVSRLGDAFVLFVCHTEAWGFKSVAGGAAGYSPIPLPWSSVGEATRGMPVNGIPTHVCSFWSLSSSTGRVLSRYTLFTDFFLAFGSNHKLRKNSEGIELGRHKMVGHASLLCSWGTLDWSYLSAVDSRCTQRLFV